MYYSLISALLVSPLAAEAARGRPSCKPHSTHSVTEIVTVTGTAPTSPPSLSNTLPTITSSRIPIATTSTTNDELPEESVDIPGNSQSSATLEQPTSSKIVSSPYTDATEVDVDIKATKQCGNDDRLIMPGMAWTVANSMYNSAQMEGTQCTNFKRVLEAPIGVYLVEWESTTNIDQVEETEDLCKGYSNIGAGVNLEERLSDIQSIPAYFKWSRNIDGNFKGSHVFDFITSSTEGAGEEPGSNEFMLFLRTWGGQIPIGYGDGPVGSFDLYNSTWQLYEGENESSGQMVYSLIPNTPFESEFEGDLKVWLDAMADAGYTSMDEFVNIGNGGVEVFYGDSQMEATVALDIVV